MTNVIKKAPVNIIFLDIDGVLNSIDLMIASGGEDKLGREQLDIVSVGLLRSLCLKTNAYIVVSSTWRKIYSKGEFNSIFRKYDWPEFKNILLGFTPVLHSRRGFEIEQWLNDYQAKNKMRVNYLIFDDDSDMLPTQLDNFIHVSNINGFRSEHYAKALRLLGQPDERLEQQVFFKKG